MASYQLEHAPSSYALEQALEYTLWRHKKGGLYICLGVFEDSTNGNEDVPYVTYWSQSHKHLRIRKASEFLDGRFTPLGTTERELLDALGSPIAPDRYTPKPPTHQDGQPVEVVPGSPPGH